MISESSRRFLAWAVVNRPKLCGNMAKLDILLNYLPELNDSLNFVEMPIDAVEQMFYTENIQNENGGADMDAETLAQYNALTEEEKARVDAAIRDILSARGITYGGSEVLK